MADDTAKTEILHGREATILPVRGFDDFVVVIFSGEGPLPDYDIIGDNSDVSLSEFMWHHTAEFDSRGLELGDSVEFTGVSRRKLSRDYKHAVDAFGWREAEAKKGSVARDRGALYLMEDRSTRSWAVWLETWPEFFSRTHVSKSRKRIARELEHVRIRSEVEFAAREAARIELQRKDLAKPSTWITLAVLGVLVMWGLFKAIFH